MQTTMRFRSPLLVVSLITTLALSAFAFSVPFAHGSNTTATPALVQSVHNSTAGAATFASAVTNGNTVIVGVTAWNTTLSATNIKDSKGNTYTRVGETVNPTSGDHAAIYYAKNVIGGTSFKVTATTGDTVAIFEYSGLSTSSPLDKSASATGNSNAPLSPNVTALSGNELYFGLVWSGANNDTWTAGPGYNLRETEINNNTHERLATEDMVLVNASAANASFKTGKSSDWIAVVATFVPQTIGGTPPPPAVPTISSFSAAPVTITAGQSSTLSWATTGATLITIDQNIGVVTGTSKSVTPTATTTYTLSAGNSAGTTTATVTVNVAPVVVTPPPPSKPTITSFTATPAKITAGQSSTLAWSITGATLITIDNGVGVVTGTSKSVSPTATTTYTISAGNSAGTTTSTVVVNVAPVVVTPPPPAKPVVSSFTASPTNITAGQSSTLSWATTGATLITIDQNIGVVTGTSKSVTPTATTTYTLSAGNSAGTTTATVTVNVAPVVVTPPPPSTNLITNGNLEAGSANAPTGWTHDYWGSLTAVFTYPVTGNGGGKAAQLQITKFSSGAANWIFNHVTDSTHAQYQFSEDYMATVPTELDIEYKMSDGTYDYEWLQTVPAATSWKTITAQITPPTGAVSFTVLHILAAKGTLTIDNASLTTLTDPFAAGMVSLIFDDGLLSQYQNALPIIKAAGMNAGFYIITTEPTSGDSGYMSWAQIKDLNTKGYEVGGHTRTHPMLTSLTTAQLTSEVTGSFTDLKAQGITPKTFVYPFGDVNPTVEAAVKTAGYQAARGSYFGLNGTVTDRYNLYDIRVDSTSNLATLEKYVDQAKADKRWLVLELHDVVASGGDEYAITPAFFQSLVTYIKSSGVQVTTMQQGMSQLSN